MIRSFFTATSGVITENKNLSVRSNNIANTNTAGFKKDTPINSTFAGMLLTRLSNEDPGTIGDADFMNIAQTPFTDHTQGGFDDTERIFDCAILGDGYFSVQTEGGQTYLTRNGEFYLSADGYLCHVRGGYVLDDNNAPINIGEVGDQFSVSSSGDIIANGEILTRIGVTNVNDLNTLMKIDEGFFTRPDDAYINEAPRIKSKTLEHSNVNITQEMADVIASSRHFQACSQVMKMVDEMTQQTVTEIAKMS